MREDNPVTEVIAEAQKLDLRRQQQIDRQKRIIDRLVEENQLMEDFIESLPGQPGIAVTLNEAKVVLAQVHNMRQRRPE